MHQIFCSTGTMIGRPNGRDFRLLKQFCPRLECDGFEFILYDSWYAQIEDLTAFLKEIRLNIPVLHCEKSLTEHIARGGEEEEKEAFRLFEINCRLANDIGAEKMVLHLWNGIISDTRFENNLRVYPALRDTAEKHGLTLLVSCIGIIRISNSSSIPRWRTSTASWNGCTRRNMTGSGRKTISSTTMSMITAGDIWTGTTCGCCSWARAILTLTGSSTL